MSIDERVKQIVIETLRISPAQYSEELAAGDIPQWDSIAHVRLLQAVENAFSISFDVGDAIAVEDVTDLIETTRRYCEAV